MATNHITRVFGIERDEVAPALLSALLFFLILCGYYILRPIREEMGLAGGVRNLPNLYLINLGVMLALAPVFGAVAARWARRVFVPAVYIFFMLNMLVFFVLMRVLPAEHDIALGRVFYVWVSVYNMWAVSLFWAFMADGFSLKRSKRLFGMIAVGGSAGAALGSTITAQLTGIIGVPYLILVSAGLMLCAALLIRHLGRRLAWAQKEQQDREATEAAPGTERGRFWSGFTKLVRSPYLSAAGGYILAFTILSTFLYFQQAEIVSEAAADRAERTRIFASIDLWANILTFSLQLFLTGRLITGLGVGPVLMLLPAVYVVGFTALGASPVLKVLIAFQVIRRAANYALSKPARETLYTIVGRDQKYKVKSLLDTFVYRGGDVIGSQSYNLLVGAVGLSGLALVTVPLAMLWCLSGYYLGRKQSQLVGESFPEPSSPDEP
jgi:AAA family ATP:ADP antiporter